MRRILCLVAMGLMLLLAPGCQTQTESTATAVPAGLPNPASVFCEAQGYALEMRDDIAGTSGYCQFPDGSECEEWAFFRGECWPESLHWGPETIEIVMLESFPIQVQVVLTGELPNSCSLVSDVTQAYDAASRTFKLTLVPGVNGAIDCDPTGLPFTETVPLDVLGLPAGNYTVSSHDVQTTFTFDVDNVAPE